MTVTVLELPGPGDATGTGVVTVELAGPTERALRAASPDQAFAIAIAAVQATLYRYLDQDEITVLIASDEGTVARSATAMFAPAISFAALRDAVPIADRSPEASNLSSASNVVCSRWSDGNPPDTAGEILQIGLRDAAGRSLAIAYDRTRFAHTAVARLAEHLGRLLSDALARPDARVDELALLGPDDLHALDRLGVRALELGPPATIHALIEAQVRRAPARVAAVCDRETVSYEALDRRATAIASALRDAQVVPGAVVAIELARSSELLAAVLGVLKAGAAFLMIDPEHPLERRALLVRRSGARVVLARGPGDGEATAARLDVAEIAIAASAAPGVPVAPDAPAYVVFTSGSTGEPKAVVVRHDAFVHRMRWLAHAYQLGPDDVSLAKSPLSFDPAICEMLRVLPLGGRVGFLAHGDERDPACLLDAIARHRATIIDLVPSPLAALLHYVAAHGASAKLASLRFVLAGAENLPPALVRDFQQLVHAHHGTRLINTWGATETTVDVTWFDCSEIAPDDRIPVGAPIANTELRVLGRAGQLLPIGMVGELYVGGIAVAAGYLDDPAATARQFVRIAALGDGRYYRSGDAVRWRRDGNLEFLRRLDEQLKIRGVRIEPGEVAAALERHPQVARAIVRGSAGGDGDPLLLAYAVPRLPAPTADELLAWLRARLPALLVPDHVFVLERFATNSSEKIDLRSLPLPQRDARTPGPGTTVSGGDATERAVAEIWSEVLDGALPGPADDFFRCGGHSLAATRLATRVYLRLGVELAVRDVFAHPTLAGLAACVRGRAPTSALAAIPRSPVSAPPRASHAQRRIWVMSQQAQASRAYNVPVTLEVSARLDHDRLQRAIDRAIARHEILRTGFAVDDGELLQDIHRPQDCRVIVSQFRAADAPDAEPLLRDLHGRPFDLAHGPLLRCSVIELGNGRTILAITVHHLIADAWSIGILVRELFTAQEVSEPEAPPPTMQYRDYAAWHDALLAGPIGAAHQRFWRKELAGDLPMLELPTDYPRPATRSYHGRSHSFVVESELALRLSELARDHRASLFMVLLAGWSVLLHRHSRQSQFVIGTPVAGRDHPDLEDQLGCFVNSLPLRIRCDGGAGIAELLASVRSTCLTAFEHQTYPFDRMVIDLAPPRRPDRSPIFDVMLVLQNAPDRSRNALGSTIAVRELDIDPTLGKLDLIVTFTEASDGRLHATIQYDAELFAASTIVRMSRHLLAVLTAAVADPSTPVGSYPLAEVEPSELMGLDKPPDGTTGDRDRGALADRRAANGGVAAMSAARTEQLLLALWQELLDRDDLSTTDDFFAVGGHSLTAVQLVVRMRERFGIAIDIAELFARPTIASLARIIDGAGAPQRSEAIAPVAIQNDYPLSAIQRQFWMLEQFRAPGEGNHTPEIEVIAGDIDRSAAAAALGELFARFEILRTRFVVIGREPRSMIDPPGDATAAFRWTDVASSEQPDRTLQSIYDAACAEPFDLTRGGLLRLHLVRRGPRNFVALWSAHHIVSDGWSLVAMSRAWRAGHDAHLANERTALPAPRVQYKDVAAWHERYLASAAGQAQIAEWAERLTGLAMAPLPGDRGGRCSFRARVCELVLDATVAAGLARVCQARQATLFMGLSALVKATLYLHLGGHFHDIALGSPIANRITPDIEDQPGPFLNVVVLRDRIDGGDTLWTLIDRIKATAQWAYARSLVPLDRITERLSTQREHPDRPLFDIGLTLQSQSRSGTVATGLRTAERFFGLTTGIWLDACEDQGGIQIAISYDEARFHIASITMFRDLLAHVASIITQSPSTPLDRTLTSASHRKDSTIQIELDA